MVGVVTAITIDADDRTVDITVEVSTDAGQLLATDVCLVPIDSFSEQLVIDKVKNILRRETLKRSPLPYSQAQIEAKILGLTVRS